MARNEIESEVLTFPSPGEGKRPAPNDAKKATATELFRLPGSAATPQPPKDDDDDPGPAAA